MVALPAASLLGIAAMEFDLALAEIRADAPQPEPNPALTSGPAGSPGEAETKPYKKLSLEELINIEVSTVSRTESTVGQSAAAVHVITPEDMFDGHHPESGTSTAVRSPAVEIRRGIYGKVTWQF